jgi:hypothetical protein
MIREQKRAWAIVISMSLAAIFCMAAGATHYFGGGSMKGWILAAAVVQAAGVIVFFRFKPDKGAVAFDERDKQLQRNASLAGFGAAYLFIILASFAPIAILGENASMPVKWMPLLLVGAGLCQAYAFFVAILVQYGRSDPTGGETIPEAESPAEGGKR